MQKKNNSHIKKGLVIAGALILLDLFAQYWGHRIPQWFGYLSILSLVGAVGVSCLLYVKANGPQKFGDIFAHGFKTTAMVTCVMAVYTYLAVKMIYPPPTAAEIAATAQAIQQQGNTMPQEAQKLAQEGAAKLWIIYVPKEIFVTLVSGLLGSLLGAAITKKNQ